MNQITTNPIGRPTEYREEFNQLADEYLQTCGREQTRLPKVTEFYRMIGISRQCGDEWSKKYPAFGDTIKKIMEHQQEELIDDGLFGGKEVNASMAIFLLKANHGLIETSRTELGGVDGQPIQISASRGFIPPGTPITSTPDGDNAIEPSEIQGSSMAPKSP